MAEATCAEIAETREFESARRVRLINEARERFGAAPMLRGNEIIKTAFSHGLCEELIHSDKRFDAAFERMLDERAREQESRREEARAQSDQEFERKLARESRQRSNRAKLIAWFNSSYSIELRNLYLAERAAFRQELGSVIVERPAEHGVMGELVINCVSAERCDQLRDYEARHCLAKLGL